MTLLVTKDTILIKVNFLVGEMSKFLAIGWDSVSFPKVSDKGLKERGTVRNW